MWILLCDLRLGSAYTGEWTGDLKKHVCEGGIVQRPFPWKDSPYCPTQIDDEEVKLLLLIISVLGTFLDWTSGGSRRVTTTMGSLEVNPGLGEILKEKEVNHSILTRENPMDRVWWPQFR